ncbi:hypothetical protein SAMN05216199_2823 [Pedococcus cremeus]|uniref:Integral membrane protein n=1 Tax=Pedococcus cremeus TaxID=587636 RepID=A0A1H9WEG2_9MICO|nr:hypothetical protein [Pedococcus cremeus]SES31833.1 hypothetical protein SAMN05216199_2823 [Pedococcus cremeus]
MASARRSVPTEESTAATIYGVIVSAGVMAAAHAETALAVVVAVLVTLVIYWVAERYARLVAERIHRGHRPTWAQAREQLTDGWEMVSASYLPLAVLSVLSLLGVELYGAVLSALVCSTVLLCVAGWAMGRKGQLTTRERVVSTVVAGLFGVVMIALKSLLH